MKVNWFIAAVIIIVFLFIMSLRYVDLKEENAELVWRNSGLIKALNERGDDLISDSLAWDKWVRKVDGNYRDNGKAINFTIPLVNDLPRDASADGEKVYSISSDAIYLWQGDAWNLLKDCSNMRADELLEELSR